MKRRRDYRTAAGIVLAALSLSAQARGAPPSEKVPFAIDAPTMVDALMQFTRQSGIQLMMRVDNADNIPARPIVGDYAPLDALQQLLNGSGLKYEWANPRTISIRSSESTHKALSAPVRTGTTTTEYLPTLRLAQSGPAPSARSLEIDEKISAEDDSANTRKPIEEVVVTGTHIRGSEIAGSNLVVIDREAIDKSGYATIEDVLKTVPQIAPGSGADFNSVPGNYLGGTGIDLRGLGAGTTLVLVNGRRQSSSGTYGNFVDITSIPTSAVERIEILPDGASAMYGSDAIGGVVNVILRKDFSGAETRTRLGSYSGDATELQASQLLGTAWETGNAFVGYQYDRRQSLSALDRDYAADSDQRRNGGDNFSSTNSNPGNIINPRNRSQIVAIPAGQDGTDLSPASFTPGTVNYRNLATSRNLLPERKGHSAFFNLSQKIGQGLEISADGRYSERPVHGVSSGFGSVLRVPTTNPFFVNPFGVTLPNVLVAYSFGDDFSPVWDGKTTTYDAGLGVRAPLGADWAVQLSGSYAKESLRYSTLGIDFVALNTALADPNPQTAFNPFGDGSHTNPATIASLLTRTEESSDSHRWSTGITADGVLAQLPGGNAKLAVGLDYRTEVIPSTGLSTDRVSSLSRDVSSVLAEVSVPLVSRANAFPAAKELSVSIAARYEHYSDFGDTTNPRIGLNWKPVDAIKIRTTWGTSFRAPNLTDQESTVFHLASADLGFDYPDPASPTGTSNVLTLFGVNPNLHEERARSWTAGFDLTPAVLSGFTLSATYTDIKYRDRIGDPMVPGGAFAALTNEDVWFPIITRNPTQAEIDAICNGPSFFGVPGSCETTPPVAIIDMRERNLAYTRSRTLDLRADQMLQTNWGKVTFGLDGTYSFSNEQAVTREAPAVDILDQVNTPLSLRVRGRVSWAYRAFDMQAAMNYDPSYDDPLSGLSGTSRTVSSWFTTDFTAAYRTPDSESFLGNIEARVSVINVFDKDPPYVNTAFGYDGINADPYGRLVSLQLRKTW